MEIPMGLKSFQAIPLLKNEQELEWLNDMQSNMLYGNVGCFFLCYFPLFFFLLLLRRGEGWRAEAKGWRGKV